MPTTSYLVLITLLKMFYEGDLQSGITLAIQQAKLVVCFVHGACSSILPHPAFATAANPAVEARRGRRKLDVGERMAHG